MCCGGFNLIVEVLNAEAETYLNWTYYLIYDYDDYIMMMMTMTLLVCRQKFVFVWIEATRQQVCSMVNGQLADYVCWCTYFTVAGQEGRLAVGNWYMVRVGICCLLGFKVHKKG